MNRYLVRFRASRRRTKTTMAGMKIWVNIKAVDACLTRNIDVMPEARVFYVGEIEAADHEEVMAALNLCYEHLVPLRITRLPRKTTKKIIPPLDPWPPRES